MSLEIKGGILRKYRGDEPGVDIPDGVLAIDEYAFRGTVCIMCRSLTA